MSALRKEMTIYVQSIPEKKLRLLQPLLRSMAEEEDFVIETDLTDEEKAIIAKGRKARKEGKAEFVSFSFN